MSLNHPLQSRTTWVLRTLGWGVGLLIVFALIYRVTFRKQVERTVNCLDRASSEERTTSPLAAVNKYAKCVVRSAAVAADARPARCRYAGVWAATRGEMVYDVTLESAGLFVAEPAQNTPVNARVITGAWAVVGRTMVWAYDSGAVWPPDINAISADTGSAFTLMEVNGVPTRYTLIDRAVSDLCNK